MFGIETAAYTVSHCHPLLTSGRTILVNVHLDNVYFITRNKTSAPKKIICTESAALLIGCLTQWEDQYSINGSVLGVDTLKANVSQLNANKMLTGWQDYVSQQPPGSNQRTVLGFNLHFYFAYSVTKTKIICFSYPVNLTAKLITLKRIYCIL